MAWHPDFRIRGELPDIKAVRTNFALNLIMLVMLAISAAYFGIYYLRANEVEVETGALRGELAILLPKNKTLLTSDRLFRKELYLFEDLKVFYDQSINPVELLSALADHRPEEIIFDGVMYREEVQRVDKVKVRLEAERTGKPEDTTVYYLHELVLEGIIIGDYSESLNNLSSFIDSFQSIPEVKKYLYDVDIVSLTKLHERDAFEYTLKMTFKVESAL